MVGLVSPVREGHWKESGWARTALWLSRERGRPHARLGMCTHTHLFFPFSSILTHVLYLYFSRTPEHIAQKKRGQSFRRPETHGLGEGGKKIAREGPTSGLVGLGFDVVVPGPPYLLSTSWQCRAPPCSVRPTCARRCGSPRCPLITPHLQLLPPVAPRVRAVRLGSPPDRHCLPAACARTYALFFLREWLRLPFSLRGPKRVAAFGGTDQGRLEPGGPRARKEGGGRPGSVWLASRDDPWWRCGSALAGRAWLVRQLGTGIITIEGTRAFYGRAMEGFEGRAVWCVRNFGGHESIVPFPSPCLQTFPLL